MKLGDDSDGNFIYIPKKTMIEASYMRVVINVTVM